MRWPLGPCGHWAHEWCLVFTEVCCKCRIHTGFRKLCPKREISQWFYVTCLNDNILDLAGEIKCLIKSNATCFFLLWGLEHKVHIIFLLEVLYSERFGGWQKDCNILINPAFRFAAEQSEIREVRGLVQDHTASWYTFRYQKGWGDHNDLFYLESVKIAVLSQSRGP